MIGTKPEYDGLILSRAHDHVARWRAEYEAASANLKLARQHEHAAHLISQHEPVAGLGVDRETLRALLRYVEHGDLARLAREIDTNPSPEATT